MTPIGTFTTTANGFEGRLRTLTLDIPLKLVAQEPGNNVRAPTYRVLRGEGKDALEVGAGWQQVGEKAGAFVVLVIDDPALPLPLRANLFEGDAGTHLLTFSRPLKRKAQS